MFPPDMLHFIARVGLVVLGIKYFGDFFFVLGRYVVELLYP